MPGLVVAALLVAAPGPQTAGQTQDPTLEAIGHELERLRRDLAEFEKEQTGILGAIERLSMQRLLLEEELRRVELERARSEQAVAATTARRDAIEVELAEGREYLTRSLREAYKLGRLRHYRILLEAEDAGELARAYRYLSEWTRADSARVQGFLDDTEELAAVRDTLLARVAELDGLEREGRERRAELERNRAARVGALRRVEQERAAGSAAVLELEEAADRLEELVRSLPAGQRVAIDGRLVDLYRFRGHLPWPAAGPVSRGFGSIRDPRFGTQRPHPGIGIEVPEGTPVTPVFGGWVVFADWFRGYGHTIMVDHGGGVLSIYAHLRAVEVGVGQRVDPGTRIGRSGSTGSLDGPTLYLEIREAGKAVDPRKWLSPAPARD